MERIITMEKAGTKSERKEEIEGAKGKNGKKKKESNTHKGLDSITCNFCKIGR